MAAGNPGPPMMLVVPWNRAIRRFAHKWHQQGSGGKTDDAAERAQIFIQQKLVLNSFARRTFDQDGVFALPWSGVANFYYARTISEFYSAG
jgi:hypothetical protein